jgi:hypothetical protein
VAGIVMKTSDYPKVIRINEDYPKVIRINEVLPFRVRFSAIGVPGAQGLVPPIGIAIIGVSNYIL